MVKPPTLPRNINRTRITCEITPSPGVMPSVSPTVPTADAVSKIHTPNGRSSTIEITAALIKQSVKYIRKSVVAVLTVPDSILLPKHSGSSFLLKEAIAFLNSTATVTVFIPPAVDPGEPPISIRMIITARPNLDIELRSSVLKPAVLGVTA